MKLHSRVKPPYLPEADQTSVLRLGLQPLSEQDWMLVDADLPSFHRHKLEQYSRHRHRVCLTLPGSEAAQQEFGQALLHHLVTHHAGDYSLLDHELVYDTDNLHWPVTSLNLSQSSLWVQEDICLLQRFDSDYVMTAASVCSPSNWALEDKIGKTLDVIHDPVPGYSEVLATRVNRLLAGLRPGKAIQRYNWSIQPNNELLWRDDLNPVVEDEAYWRVERQTLICLPETRAIVFGIRIFLHSFETMRQFPGFEETLSVVLQSLPQEEKTYKHLHSATAAK